MLLKTKFIYFIFTVLLLTSCNQDDSPKKEEREVKAPQTDSFIGKKGDAIGLDTSGEGNNLAIIRKIFRNRLDGKDSLLQIYKKALGTTIDSMAPNSYVLNFWYGGSGEDVFFYLQRSGKYYRDMDICGCPGFKVLDLKDHGRKRVKIWYKRTHKPVIFIYDGKSYRHFIRDKRKFDSKAEAGEKVLLDLEIYLGCHKRK